MKIDVTLPSLGVAILDAQLNKWLIKEGDKVKKDQPIVEVETDKVNFEVVSPIDGILLKRLFFEGMIVKVNEPLAIIGSEDEAIEKDEINNKKSEKKLISDGSKKIENNLTNNKKRFLITPVAKDLAKIRKINLDNVKGTGKEGLIIKEDILKHSSHLEDNSYDNLREERIPISGIRKKIAENLLNSKMKSAQVTNMIEVDMTNVVMIKTFLKEKYLKKGFKLTFLPFVIKAAILSLKHFPYINSTFDGQDIILRKYINFGIAMESPKGLIVPVIHEIEQYTFLKIAEELNILTRKANENNLTPEYLGNSTITISNGGIFGTVFSTAIIPSKQTALLWMGRVRKAPVVNQLNQIVVGNVMNLCISYDHQIIDGSEASQFLKEIKDNLEQPGILLVD